MPVRCLRCGAAVEGLKQFCDDCAATQPRSIFNPVAPPVEPAVPGLGSAPSSAAIQRHCLRCGSLVPADAGFCPVCGAAIAGGARPEMVYGGFWIRLLAWIADSIVVGVITAPIELLVDSLTTAFLFQVTVGAIYAITFWLAKGATPGKMALGMQVVMADGRPITGIAAVFRYIGYLLSFLTLGFGHLMIATTSEKRGLHDYIAGTVVVRKA